MAKRRWLLDYVNNLDGTHVGEWFSTDSPTINDESRARDWLLRELRREGHTGLRKLWDNMIVDRDGEERWTVREAPEDAKFSEDYQKPKPSQQPYQWQPVDTFVVAFCIIVPFIVAVLLLGLRNTYQ